MPITKKILDEQFGKLMKIRAELVKEYDGDVQEVLARIALQVQEYVAVMDEKYAKDVLVSRLVYELNPDIFNLDGSLVP